MDIVIDFDGTCVTHEFPKVGKDIGAVPVLKELIDNGHRLILFTMRSDEDNGASDEFPNVHGGKYLTDAINWFKRNDIELFGIQRNPTQTWTTSPKAYGQIYIDDAALGCPLIYDKKVSRNPFVDWVRVRKMLEYRGLLNKK
jgi:hypothetical protein